MKKLVLSAILILALVIAAFPLTASAAEGTPITTAEEFEKMVSGGTYYLANDIDFGGKQYECYILPEFSGVLNGNGFSIYNFSIDNNGQETDIGVILRANKTGNLEINNLNIGKPDKMVTLNTTASGKSAGVLAGAQQDANRADFNDVNIYANFNVPTSGKANIGGFIGYSRAVTFTNCSFNGSISVGSGGDNVDEVYHNAGGFIGSCNSALTTFSNCENNGDITTYCSTLEARAAGFISYTAHSVTLENCRNNGNITVEDCGLQLADGQCAGFIAHANKTTPVILDNCTNYGKITASNWCAGFVANATSGALFTNCVNEGEYKKDAAISGPFVANVAEDAIVEYEGVNVDKIDPSVTWGTTASDTTPEPTPTTTTPHEPAAPTTTTPSVPDDTPHDTTTVPVTTPSTPNDTTAVPTTSEDTTSSGGCGSAMISVGLVAVLGAGWLALRKKED